MHSKPNAPVTWPRSPPRTKNLTHFSDFSALACCCRSYFVHSAHGVSTHVRKASRTQQYHGYSRLVPARESGSGFESSAELHIRSVPEGARKFPLYSTTAQAPMPGSFPPTKILGAATTASIRTGLRGSK